jgi:hypothetical protein
MSARIFTCKILKNDEKWRAARAQFGVSSASHQAIAPRS